MGGLRANVRRILDARRHRLRQAVSFPLAVVLVLILAFGVGPRFFRGQPSDVNVTIEAPKVPAAPAAPKG